MSKPRGITSGIALQQLQGIKYNASSAALTLELMQEAYNKMASDTSKQFYGGDMAGWCTDNKDFSIKKVKNGYIVSVGYDQYVFRTLAQVNKAVLEYFSQPAKKEDNE